MYGPGYQGLGVAWIAMGFVFLLMLALGVTVIVLQYRLSQVRPLPGGGPAHVPATPQPHPHDVSQARPPMGPTSNAVGILDERLARGDIDVSDYAARRRALQGDPGAPKPPETRIDPAL